MDKVNEDQQLQDDMKKALNRAVDLVTYTLQYVNPKIQERQFFQNMYHSYDSILKEKAFWQTKFAHPFPFFSIEMKTSFCEEGIFGVNNDSLFQVQPYSDLNERSAEKLTKLLRYQQDNSDLHKMFYLGSKSLFTLGDWFLEVFWDSEEQFYQQRDRYTIGLDGMTNTPKFNAIPGQSQRVVTKNQPNIQTLMVNSVWPDPKAISLDTARYVCIRKEYTFSELKEKEKNGEFINIDKLKGTNMPKMPTNYYDMQPYSPYVKSGNSQRTTRNSPIDSENQIVEVIHIIYLDTGEWESIGNRQVYLGKIIKYKNIKNPLTHIKNFPELDKFYGSSDFLSIANHWRLVNQYQCLEADNILMHHRGYTTILRDAGQNVQEQIENLRPGSVIVANNMGSIQHNRPDLFSPLVLQSKQDLIAQAQQPMGLNEILQGATPSSNVRSSEQFNQLANFGSKLMSLSIRNIAEGLKEIGQKWLALNYEFMDPDYTVPISDDNGSLIDNIQFNEGDMVPWAPLVVKLSADLQSQKNMKVQQMMQAINLAQNVPGFASPTAIKEFLRFQGGFQNVDRFFLLNDQQVAQMTLSQFGGGPEPQAGQNGPSQSPAQAGATRPPSPNQTTQGNQNAGQATLPNLAKP